MRLRNVKWLALSLASIGIFIHPVYAQGGEGKPVAPAAAAAAAPFSDADVHDFLEKVRHAETISDPLQRCIAYPNPPGSHWLPTTARAYCVYQLQTFMSYEDIKASIETGQAAKLDAYLRNALQKQLTSADSASLLDHIYMTHFSNASSEALTLIEAWNRQQPKSAFALTARGRTYLERAFQDRGGRYASETPRANFMRMDRWLQLARKDLEQATAIDARMIPAYSAMIAIGMLQGDDAYAQQAARKALVAQPGNYFIYSRRILMAEPKWGGSIGKMKRIVREAQRHTKGNELLKLLLPVPAAYAANLTGCDCDDPAQLNAYREVLDQMPGVEVLAGAASALDKARQAKLAVIYQSEVLRFSPEDDILRAKRISNLIAVGEKTWGKSEADELLAKPSVGPATVSALIGVYTSIGDKEGVKKCFAKMDELRPKGLVVNPSPGRTTP